MPECELRLYKGLYKVEIVKYCGAKCVVKALERTVIGNMKCGHEIIQKGTKFVTMTRLLYRCG